MKKNKTECSSLSFSDTIFKSISIISVCLTFIIVTGIFVQLVWNSRESIEKFGFSFLFTQQWNPVTSVFGAASSIYGTLATTVIAMAIAVPLSILVALFLSELAHPLISKFVGICIELLAAIPSIIYGMWGLFVFAPVMSKTLQPFLQKNFGFLKIFNGHKIGIGVLTAGIILAVMVLPFITSVVCDVFKMVPNVLKESAYGMGSTTWEVTHKVTIRYGLSSIVGACFLGLGRALGETMAVTFVIGNRHKISASLFDAGNTIASTLANEFAEASEPLYLSSLIELGLVLFVLTFIMQVLAQFWLAKMKKSFGGGL
ncbi:phosphate ABC transporter permease subunit PstC [bacterium]|nr:phosphate ABC transporter permease subunit PstC [bacterium]